MIASVIAACVVFGTSTLVVAQEGPERGRIRKVDTGAGTITVIVDGKDRELHFTDRTRFMDSGGAAIEKGLSDERFREGAAVMFREQRRDGRAMLMGIRLADAEPNRPGARVSVDTSSFRPITELGDHKYQGFPGGLYPGGSNRRPEAHENAGVALASTVKPLDQEGEPSEQGKIVLLSIGMSNATQEFSMFKQMADSDARKNPKLAIVDGAQGGMTAAVIRNPSDGGRGEQFWRVVDDRLRNAGVTRAQVQAVWVKEADAGPNQPFPKHAQTLQQELAQIAQVLAERFANLKLAYFSSRTYGGYATTRLNPEPYAYESGFAVKWLIEQQVKGDASLNFDSSRGRVRAPWLSWGPYLWANGTTPRSDGFSYEESDFANDGTHPSQSGRRKVAGLLLDFFTSDSTSRPWFVSGRGDVGASRQSGGRSEGEALAKPVAPGGEASDAPALPFGFFDRNRDGKISRRELEESVRVFDRFDRNDDAMLDREELARATRRGAGRPGEIVTPAARGERHQDSLAEGDEAPDFSLPDPAGKREIRLSSFRGKRPVVLVFSSFT